MPRSLSLLLPGSLLLVALTASAEQPPAPEPTAIYAGVPASPEAAAAAAELLGMLPDPVALTDPPPHIEQLAPRGALTAFGSAVAEACGGDPADLTAYRGHLDLLRDAAVHPDRARPPLAPVLEAQACLTETADPHDLARAHLLRGGLAALGGDADAAEAEFARAAAYDPALRWDEALPADAEPLFEEARRQVLGGGLVPIVVVVGPMADAWIDGRPVQQPTSGVSLPPGRHLVQVRPEQAFALRNLVVDTSGGEPVTVIEPLALSRYEVQDPEFVRRATRVVAGLEASSLGAPGYLVSLAPEPAVWRRNPVSGVLDPIKVPAAAVAATAQKVKPPEATVERQQARALPAMVAAGAGLMGVGAVMSVIAGAEMDRMRQDVESGATPYPHPDVDESELTDEMLTNRAAFQRYNAVGSVGVGMMFGGGVALGISIPLGAAQAQRDRRVTLAVAFPW